MKSIVPLRDSFCSLDRTLQSNARPEEKILAELMKSILRFEKQADKYKSELVGDTDLQLRVSEVFSTLTSSETLEASDFKSFFEQ